MGWKKEQILRCIGDSKHMSTSIAEPAKFHAGSFARKSGRGEGALRVLRGGGDHRQPSMKYALPSA